MLIPSELLRDVFNEHCERYGEPDLNFHYGDEGQDAGGLSPVDVFVWEACEECPVTTLTTIGMAEREMKPGGHRAELHLSIRRSLSDNEVADLALLLANLSAWPFVHGRYVDFGQLIRCDAPVPCFPNCPVVVLHPRLSEDGWDQVQLHGFTIKLFNVIPLTEKEADVFYRDGVAALYDRFDTHNVDPLLRA